MKYDIKLKASNITPRQVDNGDIIAVHRPFDIKSPATYLSAAIRKFTKGFWNHSDMFVKVHGELYVIGAIGRGVVPIHFDEWRRMHRRYFIISKADRKYTTTEILKYSGKKYDFFTTFIVQAIFIIFGVWIGPKGQKAERRLNCAEFVSMVRGYKDSYKMDTMQILKAEGDRVNYKEIYYT